MITWDTASALALAVRDGFAPSDLSYRSAGMVIESAKRLGVTASLRESGQHFDLTTYTVAAV